MVISKLCSANLEVALGDYLLTTHAFVCSIKFVEASNFFFIHKALNFTLNIKKNIKVNGYIKSGTMHNCLAEKRVSTKNKVET